MNILNNIIKINLISLLISSVISKSHGADINISGHFKTYSQGIDSTKIKNPGKFITLLNALENSPYSETLSESGITPVNIREMSDGGRSILVNQRVRIKSDIFFNNTINADIEWELQAFAHERQGSSPGLFSEISLSENDYRLVDFDERLYPKEDNRRNFSLSHDLDRFSMTFTFPLLSIYAGRQAFGWGNTKLISPVDILVPFKFDALDKEERAGVDALRIVIPYGMLNEIACGYVFGREAEFNKSAFFLRNRSHFLDTDLSIFLTGYQSNLMTGFSTARAIGGTGVWVEGAWTAGNLLNKGWDKDRDFFRLTCGSDYTFNDKLYGFAEYHFSSAGEDKTGNYFDNYNKNAYNTGGVYLMSKHYMGLGGNFEIMPLLNLGFAGMWNLNDLSASIMPDLELNAAENIYFSLGAVIGAGEAPSFKDASISNFSDDFGNLINPGSEFGIYSDIYYFSMRYYF